MPKYFREVNKHFSGDKTTAARYMGVARSLLGGLAEMSGDLFQNARKVVLPDGTKITVWFAGAIAHVAVEVASAAKKISGSKVFVVIVEALWGDAFDGKKKYDGVDCDPEFARVADAQIGRLDWIDASGMPQLWLRHTAVTGRARYDGATDFTNNKTIYTREGAVIETAHAVNGVTRIDGKVYYVSIGSTTVSVYTAKDELVGSATTAATTASDKWFKFSASGNTGVILYSTQRYYYVSIVHDSAGVPSVSFGFTYTQQSRRFKAKELYSPSPYAYDGCHEGITGLSVANAIGGGQRIRAIDFVGDDLFGLYVVGVGETIHATPFSYPETWLDNMVRVGTQATAYYIRNIAASMAVDTNLSGALHVSRLRTTVYSGTYAFFDYPISHFHWTVSRILDLDIRKKACTIWSDPLYGTHTNHTHLETVDVVFNNIVVDSFPVSTEHSYVSGLPYEDHSSTEAVLTSWACGAEPPWGYTEYEDLAEVLYLADIVVEDGFRGRLMSWDTDKALVMCQGDVSTTEGAGYIENRFVCGGTSFDINSMLPNTPYDYGYAVIDTGEL